MGESFDLETPDKNMGRVPVEGWFSLSAARALFEGAGLDYEEQKQAAADRSFHPVSLGTRMKATIENELRNVSSANVIAKLEGTETEAAAPDETVLYLAHWDHLGTQESMEGDNIFNGAYDNATGVAGLLELARVFSELDPTPRRSILFLAVKLSGMVQDLDLFHGMGLQLSDNRCLAHVERNQRVSVEKIVFLPRISRFPLTCPLFPVHASSSRYASMNFRMCSESMG